MYLNIQVRETGKVIGRLNRIMTNLPKATNEDTRDIAQIYANELRLSAAQNNINNWSGQLYGSFRPIPLENKNGWSVVLPQHAAYLDTFGSKTKEWFVVPEGKQPLEQWARSKGLDPNKRLLIKKRNWIQPAIQKAQPKAKSVVSNGKISKLVKK